MKQNKKYYTSKYFAERDLLDIHLAYTIELLMKHKKLTSILDIGCGSGRLLQYFRERGYRALGCDNSQTAVAIARRHTSNTSIKIANATKLPYKSKSFDMVICISVIEHLTSNDGKLLIQQMHRILRPGGIIFLMTPNLWSPLRLFQGKNWFGYKDPTHIHFYSPFSLFRLLHRNGFRHIQYSHKTLYIPAYEWEMPGLNNLPNILKYLLTWVLISSPVSLMRNNLWVSATYSSPS